MDAARVVELFEVIGVTLFGDDTYHDPDVRRPILKAELYKLISTIVARIWNLACKRIRARNL